MILRDVLHYPRNRPVTIVGVPVKRGSSFCSVGAMHVPALVASSSKGKEIIGYLASGLKRIRFEDSDGRASSPVFAERVLRNAKARGDHEILSRLDHPEIQRQLDGLSLTELANFHDVSALKFMMSNTIDNAQIKHISIYMRPFDDPTSDVIPFCSLPVEYPTILYPISGWIMKYFAFKC
uniref:Putative ribosomal protein S11, mitochondrial n=1 Tax=Tanacetum cinerariifolium TaxID=118510 RepID=A0A699HX64_TANCI|nr:putative ribosomal protein S11, mitochondrial [Tanacetum cinerariifolium]